MRVIEHMRSLIYQKITATQERFTKVKVSGGVDKPADVRDRKWDRAFKNLLSKPHYSSYRAIEKDNIRKKILCKVKLDKYCPHRGRYSIYRHLMIRHALQAVYSINLGHKVNRSNFNIWALCLLHHDNIDEMYRIYCTTCNQCGQATGKQD